MINFVTCAFETSSLLLSKLFQLKRYTRSPYHSSDSTLCRLVLGPLLIRLIFTIVTRILDTSVPCSPWPLVLGTEHGQDHGNPHILANILVNNTLDHRGPFHLHQWTSHLNFQTVIFWFSLTFKIWNNLHIEVTPIPATSISWTPTITSTAAILKLPASLRGPASTLRMKPVFVFLVDYVVWSPF